MRELETHQSPLKASVFILRSSGRQDGGEVDASQKLFRLLTFPLMAWARIKDCTGSERPSPSAPARTGGQVIPGSARSLAALSA